MIRNTIPIIFLHILWKFSFSNSLSTCFSDVNKPRFCQPNFINIVNDATATTTSTCGMDGATESVCNLSGFDHCVECSNRLANVSKDPSFLIDRHVRGQETFWLSGKITDSKMINVTINLDKLYEAYYVTIEFRGKLPDSIVLFKSNDFGLSWSPWHFFSTSCRKTFAMQQTSTLKMERKPAQQNLKPVCFSLTKSKQTISAMFLVIPFNPMIGRNAIPHDSMAVKEWTSLTSLKISMNVNQLRRQKTQRIAITDVTIGGRAQCYGHASGLKKFNNSVVCDCEHKTDGQQCNKCLGTHNDQPWKPIFSSDSSARECQRCFCNNHALECSFDIEMYRKDNGMHGSRCIDCLHHTKGSHCETCSKGYYRNNAFPINHTRVCQKCKCHVIGSKNDSHCDPTNGNCVCKEGVEGATCNRCKKGYHQTRSSIKPCTPEIEKKMMATEERCGSCGKNRPRIKFKKFCRMHIMVKISIQSKEIHGDWTRYGVRVEKIWRVQTSLQSQVNLHESEHSNYPLWVENANIRCNCPNFELGQVYLLLTKIRQKVYLNQPELIVDKSSTVLKWRDNWSRRLDKFKEREKLGKCEKFKYLRRNSRRMFHTYNSRYMNDN